MSLAVIGGILLNIGAFFTFKGMIFRAVMVYLVADLCWMILAWQRGDSLGTVLILSGMFFGFLAFYKMKRGVMNQDLNPKDNG